MENKFLFIIFLLGIFFIISFSHLQENSAPIVEITSPGKNTIFSWDSMIPYTISVSDAEDGSSEYDEIPDNEIILTVKYLTDSSQVKNYLEKDLLENFETLSWMGQSNCFTCHTSKGKLIGPSFNQIAERYSGKPDIAPYLAQKIAEGTTGTWGNQIMPAQPDLEVEKVVQAIHWILDHGQKADFTYFSGTEGIINTKEKTQADTKKAVYVLTAHYIDHGSKENSQGTKKGWHHMTLKSQ